MTSEMAHGWVGVYPSLHFTMAVCLSRCGASGVCVLHVSMFGYICVYIYIYIYIYIYTYI